MRTKMQRTSWLSRRDVTRRDADARTIALHGAADTIERDESTSRRVVVCYGSAYCHVMHTLGARCAVIHAGDSTLRIVFSVCARDEEEQEDLRRSERSLRESSLRPDVSSPHKSPRCRLIGAASYPWPTQHTSMIKISR